MSLLRTVNYTNNQTKWLNCVEGKMDHLIEILILAVVVLVLGLWMIRND